MSWWEFGAKVEGWAAFHAPQKTQAPSADEFEAALARDEERLARRGQ
jgi:hypothetical protein